MILLKMKETAEAYLGTTVVNAGQSSPLRGTPNDA